MIRISINHVLRDCWFKKVFELCRFLNSENLDNWDLKWREFKKFCLEDFLEKDKMVMKPWCHRGCKYFLYYVQDAIHRKVEDSPRIMSQILSETDLEKSDILSCCRNGLNVLRPKESKQSNQSNEWTFISEHRQNNALYIYTEILDKFKITKDEILCKKSIFLRILSFAPLF